MYMYKSVKVKAMPVEIKWEDGMPIHFLWVGSQ